TLLIADTATPANSVVITIVDRSVVPVPSASQISVNASDSAEVVAAAAAAALNRVTSFGPGTATVSGDTVTLAAGLTAVRAGLVTTSVNAADLILPAGFSVIGQQIRVTDATDANNIDSRTFSYVDAALVSSPGPDEIAVRATDLPSVVATATATVLNGAGGFGSGSATAGGSTVTLSTGLTFARLVFTGSNIQVAGAVSMTVLDGATVVGEQITIGTVLFTYIDEAAIPSSTTAALDQIPVQLSDTPAAVAAKTVAAINNTALYGAGAAAVSGGNPAQIDLLLSGLTVSNADGTSLTFDGLHRFTVPNADTVIGEEILIDGTSYRFVDAAAGSPGALEIAVPAGASASTVATVTTQRINALFGANTAAKSGTTIDIPLHTVGPVIPLVLSGSQFTLPDGAAVIGDHISVGGTAFTFVNGGSADEQIGVLPGDTADQVADKTRVALNTYFGFSTASISPSDTSVVVISGLTVAGVTPASGNAVLTLTGDVDMLNQALDGLTFVPNRDYAGPASVTILTADLGQFTFDPLGQINRQDVDTVLINVLPVNDPPTIDPLANVALHEDEEPVIAGVPATQTISLTGITAGPINELEPLSVAAAPAPGTNIAVSVGSRVVNNTITIGAVSGLTTADTVFTFVDAGSVSTPGPTQFPIIVGNAVTGTAVSSTLQIASDAATVINTYFYSQGAVSDVARVLENTISLRVDSSLVTVSGTDVFHVSDQNDLLEVTGVRYSSPDETGELDFHSKADAFGIADIVVTVTDAGLDGIPGNSDDVSTQTSFTVFVTPDVLSTDPAMTPTRNDAPTLNPIGNISVGEDTGEHSVNLAGITAGPLNELDDLRVTARLDDLRVLDVAIGANVIGETLTVGTTAPVIFTYVDESGTVNVGEIGVAPTDSTYTVAIKTAAAINGSALGNVATASANYVAIAIDEAVTFTNTNGHDSF
ncbi:MAG: hypothetical protein KDA89_01440, partial [Planctomycetaceae bacterium]|nr:hypothetical protein [Planctomycetaceae bacterium]